LADKLLKSAPRDKKSLQIIEDRDEEQKSADREEQNRQEMLDALKKARQSGTRQEVAKKLRAKMKARQKTDEEFDQLLEDDQKLYVNEQKGKGKLIRKRKRDVLKYFKQKQVPVKAKKVPVVDLDTIDLTKQKKVPVKPKKPPVKRKKPPVKRKKVPVVDLDTIDLT
jgi:hypothetical protein